MGRSDKIAVSVSRLQRSAAEAVQGAALALQGVHDVHSSHGLPAGVLSVGDRVTDYVLQEHLVDVAGLLVDESRDTLHTATASQAADRGLGDALDVIWRSTLRWRLAPPLPRPLPPFPRPDVLLGVV